MITPRQRFSARRLGCCAAASACLLAAAPCTLFAQSTINATNRFGYGANIGWTDWRANGADGVVIGEYVCKGYIYAANVGWIHVGSGTPANSIQYQNNSATDYGVNHDGSGNLRGYAYGANIGWVSFENLGAPRLDLCTGILSGYIYGANVGWISLSNAAAFVQTDSMLPSADTDNDGIPDAFELAVAGNLAAMSGTSDSDNDGSLDKSEYLAGTNPLDPNDRLQITGFLGNPNFTLYTLTWTSKPAHHYVIQKRPDLSPSSTWTNISIGIIPSAGLTTSQTATDTPATQRYFRVQAVRPLIP